MNLILQAVITIWLLCVVPFLVGLLLEKTVIKENIGLTECMAFGMLGECSLFLIISVPMIQLKQSLHLLKIIWLGVAAVITAGSVLYGRRKIKEIYLNIKQSIKGYKKLFYITIGVCALSVIIAALFIQPNESGNVVEMTNRAVVTDSLYGYDAYTGEIVSTVDQSLKYSPFEMYYAVVAGITGIHPAILIKLIIPMVWIPIVYGIFYMWGKLVYPSDEKKKCMFVLAGFFLSIYPVVSNKGYGLWILNGIWQRDAFLCSFIMPIGLWVCVKTLWKKNSIMKTIFELLLCAGAAELAIFKGFYYIVFMAFVTMILWMYRRWSRCWNT